jgi:hypothetical protein
VSGTLYYARILFLNIKRPFAAFVRKLRDAKGKFKQRSFAGEAGRVTMIMWLVLL